MQNWAAALLAGALQLLLAQLLLRRHDGLLGKCIREERLDSSLSQAA